MPDLTGLTETAAVEKRGRTHANALRINQMAPDKIVFPYRQVDVASAESRFPSQGTPLVSSA